MWSNDMFVMTLSIGVMMFVQSSRPPSPTSMTAMSTSASLKYSKAMAVVSSKNDGPNGSKNSLFLSTHPVT